MRKKEEIEAWLKTTNDMEKAFGIFPENQDRLNIIAEILLDIRDLLANPNKHETK